MSVSRLRQKGRIEPASNISSRPSKPALNANLQFQDTAKINADSTIFRPSTMRGPLRHKRRSQPICPSAWGQRPLQPAACYSTSQVTGATGCDFDMQLGRGIESPLGPAAIARQAQRNNPKLEGDPARGGTTYEQPQQPTAESRSDTTRFRQRAPKEPSPATHLGAKTPHPPFPQSVYNTDDNKKRLFACPFYKSDPDTYRDCRRFGLSRVKDVKQHLQRKHSPPSYCNRCYKVFGTKESLVDHQRGDDSCERRDGPLPGSISEQQWEQLNQQYQSRGKPVEKQWEDLWHILFPGRNPPRSVYQDTELGETVSRMLAFWSANKEDITSRAAQKAGANAVKFSMDDLGHFVPLVGEFLEDFFRQFETASASSSVGAVTAVESMAQSPQNHNPLWEDDAVSVAFPVTVDPYFTMDPDAAPSSNGQLLGAEIKPPPRWESQQLLASFDREISGSENAHHLQDCYVSEQRQYDGIEELKDVYWPSHSDVPDVQMDDATLNWAAVDSQAPAHNRHTWPITNAGAWCLEPSRGGAEHSMGYRLDN